MTGQTPRKQTRRSIGLKPESYDKLKAHCDATGCSMSGKVEELIAAFFEADAETDTPSEEDDEEPREAPFRVTSWQTEDVPPVEDKPIRGGGTHFL